MLGAVVAVLAIVAAADYLFQYRQWYERQKMSLRELKEEFKQTEGDPAIKAKIRQLRQARMRKRMMAAVPKASVIITNPTHYAVALQYERGMNAPVCVAKGIDNIALKIREVGGRAQHPDRREPAARPRAACDRRDRRGDSARALQGGGRGDRLRDAAAGRGAAMRNPMRQRHLRPLRGAPARDTLARVIRRGGATEPDGTMAAQDVSQAWREDAADPRRSTAPATAAAASAWCWRSRCCWSAR